MKINNFLGLFFMFVLVGLCSAQVKIEHCKPIEEESPSLCQECDPSFGLSRDATKCLACASNCVSCSQNYLDDMSYSKSAPNFHAFAYYRDQKDMICLACDPNCTDCQDKVGCAKSSQGFHTFLKESIHSVKLSSCLKGNENCADCQNLVGCAKCKNNYFKLSVETAGRTLHARSVTPIARSAPLSRGVRFAPPVSTRNSLTWVRSMSASLWQKPVFLALVR